MNTQPSIPQLALGYVRVSTDRQDLSVEAQVEAVRRAADYHKLAPVEFFLEPDTGGGTEFAKREQGARLIARVKDAAAAGQTVTIVVPKVDRLGRGVVDIDQTVTLFEKLGARMLFLDINVDTRTAMGRAFLQISAVFAQLELARIRERIQTVLDHKREANQLTGSLCFGWNVRYNFGDGHTLVRTDSPLPKAEREALSAQHGGLASTQLEDNPGEQKWILQMAHLYHNCGWSYSRIAKELNFHDVPTKRAGQILNLRTRASADQPSEQRIAKTRWQFGQVETILNNATVKAWLANRQQLAA